jgi:hypothetical protein
MGIFDKAKDLAAQHNETIDAGIDQAADFIDSRTGGQHSQQIDGVSEQVKDKIDEFAGTSPLGGADPLAQDAPVAQPDPAQPAPGEANPPA